MNNFKKSLIWPAVVFSAIIFSGFTNAYAFLSKNDIGTTSAQFLKLGVGARSAGLGNAVTSVYAAADSIYSNPANLSYMTRKELSFSHVVWFEDINYEWLAFALPTQKAGVFAAAVQYVSYGSISRTDNTNVSDGSFSPLDMAAYLSYANRYREIYFGLNLKYIYSKIENSASAVAADFGINYDFADNKTSLGAAVTNAGTKMKFNKEEENLPLLFKTGISRFFTNDWLVCLDLNFPKDNDFYVNIGTEYYIAISENADICLRAGYDGRNKDIPGFNWLNIGFGLRYSDYCFDYAFVPYGDIGMTHRFSFGIKFGREVK